MGCPCSGESRSLQLSQLPAEALAPSPDSFHWSSHPLKAGGEGTGIAFHPSDASQWHEQNLWVAQVSPKYNCGDGSPTEVSGGITGCNVLQKLFQKTPVKRVGPNQNTTSTVPSMASHIWDTSPRPKGIISHVHLLPVHLCFHLGHILLLLQALVSIPYPGMGFTAS